MKPAGTRAALLLLVLATCCSVAAHSAVLVAAGSGARSEGARTVTEVVKILKGMLEKSEEESEEDRKIYAKLMCYCREKEEKKTDEIAELTKEIDLLESDIEELQGENAELSTASAKLVADMAENKQAQKEAKSTREEEAEEFAKTEKDLEDAIGQMRQAIDTLAEVGADQTRSNGANDNEQFMAGFKGADLISLGTKVKEALKAASAFMGDSQRQTVGTFLQAPFTGSYTAQSGEVVGILKNMRDTFVSNLATARKTEKDRKAAYLEFMVTKQLAFDDMKRLNGDKQAALGENDSTLGTKKEQLSDAKEQRSVREEFLEKLRPMCSEKTKEYKARSKLRANEDAAISQAVAILDKDSAFAAFGKVKATSKAAEFFQRSALRRHHGGGAKATALGQMAVRALRTFAGNVAAFPRLAKAAALLQSGNPFTTTLEEITKMLENIKEEGKVDHKKNEWCKKELSDAVMELGDIERSIERLEGAIEELDKLINEPETGLKAMISQTQDELQENRNNQKEKTSMRKEENVAYQKNMKNLAEAEGLLTSAIKALKKYYDNMDTSGTVSKEVTEMPGGGEAPPEGFEADGEAYDGQSGKGNKAIEMLEFIKGETKKEENAAHKGENEQQHLYEDLMAELTEAEKEMQSELAGLEKQLATAEADLLAKQQELEKAKEEAKKVMAYIEEITPECNWMAENIEARDESRKSESGALKKVTGLIKETPAYKTAKAKSDLEALGDCKEPCTADPKDAECKACMAKVSVPGYCAGHPGTPGC